MPNIDYQEKFYILYRKYRALINYWALQTFRKHQRLQYADTHQIALIAFYKAVVNYKQGNCRFLTYAKTGITLALNSEIRHIYRQTINTLSLNDQFPNSDETYIDYVKDENLIFQPQNYCTVNETIDNLTTICKQFSNTKIQIYNLRISGFNNTEIAKALGISKRQVEYQIQQIKKAFKKDLLKQKQ